MRRGAAVSVLGGGAWGTALALAAERAGCRVTLCMRNAEQADAINATGENTAYLPGVALPAAIKISADMRDIGAGDLVIAAVPAQSLRGVISNIASHVKLHAPIVVAAKGIEQTSGHFLSDVINEILPQNPAALLSGPSFATDVARGLPTAVTLAAKDDRLAQQIAEVLASPTFRLYHTDDLRGAEIGGAAKNVLAIAAGITAGRGLGASASAALIARGFAELTRFGLAFGARPETLMGLSGLGDLILTCNSSQSRNFSLGLNLGRGMSVSEAMGGKLAEGVYTASVLVKMAKAKGVDMPIAMSVDAVLSGHLTIGDAIDALLARPSKAE